MRSASLLALAAALALHCGCAAPGSPGDPACVMYRERGVSSDPPEFAACSEAAQHAGQRVCGERFQCIRGLCTLPCTTDADCSGTSAGDRLYCLANNRCALRCVADEECRPGTRCLAVRSCVAGDEACARDRICQPLACVYVDP